MGLDRRFGHLQKDGGQKDGGFRFACVLAR
jgi:hypothetical protein